MKKSFLWALLLSLVFLQSHHLEARGLDSENPVTERSIPSTEVLTDVRPDSGSILEPSRTNPYEVEVPADASGIPASLCEIPSDQISSIQFYAANCLTPREEYEIDLNLQCTTEGIVYRSYCNEAAPVCLGRIVNEAGVEIPLCTGTAPESAATCLRRQGCSLPRGTTPTPPPPADSLPGLSAISPNTAREGSAAFNLTVTGTNFTNASVVLWNGRNKTTHYVSATELHAQIDAADIAHAGDVPVTVLNGAHVSSALQFTISAAPAERRDTSTTTSTAPRTGTTSPETVINPQPGSDHTNVNLGDGGGCVLALGTSESMSFGLVGMSFVLGSFLMLRKRKK